MTALGINEIDIKILLREHKLEHWGIRGTVASKRALGFDVDV